MYAEYRAFLAALDGDAGELPRRARRLHGRCFDRVVETQLENTEAARVILYRLFDHPLPRPRRYSTGALDAVGGRPGRRRTAPR
ncbi:hypothetical protein LV779_24645 [Streptomyces thinghirensis]|nr:hypothetical protein [Streptomyces thinghirensis]